MSKFLKMTEAEDVTTTEEIPVVLENAIQKDVKEILLQEEREVSEAKDLLKDPLKEAPDALTEHQDAQKVSEILLDPEDQEEINSYC